MPTTIYLVRHGATMLSAEDAFAGLADVALSPEGRRQATASIVVFIRTERRAPNPVLPPDLVAHRTIGPSLLGSLLLGICFLSLDTYVPLYVQGGLGGDGVLVAGIAQAVAGDLDGEVLGDLAPVQDPVGPHGDRVLAAQRPPGPRAGCGYFLQVGLGGGQQ